MCNICRIKCTIVSQYRNGFRQQRHYGSEKISAGCPGIQARQLTTMTDETVLRCCEALDNSKLVIFGLAFNGWDKIFSNKSIAASFTEFLRRGGIAYFGTQTYDSLGKFSAAAIKSL